jgi:diacylglycerol kinase family enzyme
MGQHVQTEPVATSAAPRQAEVARQRGGTLHFVMNGRAGNQDDDATRQAIVSVLGSAGRNFQMHVAEQPADLARVAAEAAVQAGRDGSVVAVGGDGTINTVVAALLGSQVPLGLLPRGTFNYTARAHGIPLEPEPAVQLLLQARPQPVQVGLLNGHPFLVNASLGLYPQLLEDREAFKKRFGRTRLVALWAALVSTLRRHPALQLRVVADGQAARDLRVSTLFVGNNPLQLEALGLPEAARAGSSGLAALALRAFRPGELLWLGLQGALGRLGSADDLTHFTFRELTVLPRSTRQSLKVALDGEITRMRPPLVFAVDARPLWLLRPEGAGPPSVQGDGPPPVAPVAPAR